MTNFNDFLKEQLQDKEFKAEYDALETEFSIENNTHSHDLKAFMEHRKNAEENGLQKYPVTKLTLKYQLA